jgi:alpha-1,6-mannosyltransferase
MQYSLGRETGVAGPLAEVPPQRTMDDHFRELFATYEALIAPNARAA